MDFVIFWLRSDVLLLAVSQSKVVTIAFIAELIESGFVLSCGIGFK